MLLIASNTDSSMAYNMNHKKRGKALIFNQEKFQYLKERRGTNKDRDNLSERYALTNIHRNMIILSVYLY